MATNTATALEDIHDTLRDEADARYHRLMNARPLPDAHDVARYLDASRALAGPHFDALATGQSDWARGTALHSLLFRTTDLYPDTTFLVPACEERVANVGLEAGYVAAMLADAHARLDPDKDHELIARLTLFSIAMTCSMMAVSLAHGVDDAAHEAKCRTFIEAFPAFCDALRSPPKKASAKGAC